MIGNAVKVMRIATGEEAEDLSADDGKDKIAQSLGRCGARVRANVLSEKTSPKDSQGCGSEGVGENKDLISMV